jgi:hypothetical protein
VSRELVVTYFCIFKSIFFFYCKKIFSVHLPYCFFVLDSTDITFYRGRTQELCCVIGQFRRHIACPTNLPLIRTAKIERSTFLQLTQFFHQHICCTLNLLLDKILFTSPSSTNAWNIIPYMHY